MVRNITLEVSLKPFKRTDSDYIEKVCREIFEDWRPLVRDAECVSVMMWSADGSELLDYNGRLDDSFEWACYVGGANNLRPTPKEHDPEAKGLHSRRYYYIDKPPIMTYGILKEIVATLKRVGGEILGGKPIRVGTTFDPGPEFAISDFKYKRHPEICLGGSMGKKSMVCAYTTLNGDDRPYAAYPNGIPDGTPFGTFLGKQTKIFLDDMGFDYIWLSNGIGFGLETWHAEGALFDGEKFDYSRFDEVKKLVLGFWHLFRRECPDCRVETRGTNMSMGIDLSTDGVPLRDIYHGGFNILPPPNSPWAALNFDFGLELMGHMSRIAEIPEDEYLLRYYIHDPWWMNSPWYDRYNGKPHDIYLPYALSRIDGEGRTMPPTHLNLLTIDNSLGNMPKACVNEPIPHLLRAIHDLPDDAAPLVWVYPFDEYSDAKCKEDLEEMFAGDWYIRGAINHSLPLSSVITTANFVKCDKTVFANSILVSAIPKSGSAYERDVIEYAAGGGRIVFYGSTARASEAIRELIGVDLGEGLSGELPVVCLGEEALPLLHNANFSGGDICERQGDADVLATAGGAPIWTEKANVSWVRATVSNRFAKGTARGIPHDEEKYFISESTLPMAVARLGIDIKHLREPGEEKPVITVHRHDNGYFVSSFQHNTAVELRVKTPLGIPILDAYDVRIKDGYGIYHLPKAEHAELRVFVEQADGVISVREEYPESMQFRRKIRVSGLRNATVRFLPESYCVETCEAMLNSPKPHFVSEKFEQNIVTRGSLTYIEIKDVSGELIFKMPFKEKIDDFQG